MIVLGILALLYGYWTCRDAYRQSRARAEQKARENYYQYRP